MFAIHAIRVPDGSDSGNLMLGRSKFIGPFGRVRLSVLYQRAAGMTKHYVKEGFMSRGMVAQRCNCTSFPFSTSVQRYVKAALGETALAKISVRGTGSGNFFACAARRFAGIAQPKKGA